MAGQFVTPMRLESRWPISYVELAWKCDLARPLVPAGTSPELSMNNNKRRPIALQSRSMCSAPKTAPAPSNPKMLLA
eukprot:9261024-Karenia_brevis.AAC.1